MGKSTPPLWNVASEAAAYSLTYARKFLRRKMELLAHTQRVMRPKEATLTSLWTVGLKDYAFLESLRDETKSEIKTIPWNQIYGYSGVNMRIVWDTVSEDIPTLRKEIVAYLQ